MPRDSLTWQRATPTPGAQKAERSHLKASAPTPRIADPNVGVCKPVYPV